jgi:hypothetical protein
MGSRRLIPAAYHSGKAERIFRKPDTLTKHCIVNHPSGAHDYLLGNEFPQTQRKDHMIRKTLLGFAAVAALGAAALAPTSASAWGFHHHHGGWGHWGWGFGPGYVSYDCYVVKKIYRSGAVRYFRVCR